MANVIQNEIPVLIVTKVTIYLAIHLAKDVWNLNRENDKSFLKKYKEILGNSLVVEWLELFHCHGLDSIPGWGTEILQAVQQSREKKKSKLSGDIYLCTSRGGP